MILKSEFWITWSTLIYLYNSLAKLCFKNKELVQNILNKKYILF